MVQLIMEELNVKAVVFEKNMDTYMNYSLKPISGKRVLCWAAR